MMGSTPKIAAIGLTLALLAGAGSAPAQAPPGRVVAVGSKPFGESFLLAEMFAQLLEARGFTVDRRPGLGSTEIAFRALRSGGIDIYPEYTGTGLLAVLNEAPMPDPRAVFNRVTTVFRQRYGVRWLPPLGFENTFAIAVRRETAERLQLRTLSDLAREGPGLTGGFSPDFHGRADGLPGLTRAYGLRFRATRALSQAVKYQAIAANQVDVIDGYSTDGLIARHDLVVLEDDRQFFPPYEAAALVGQDLQRTAPGAVLALSELSGRLDVEGMRRLNERIEVAGDPIPLVAGDALRALGLIGVDSTVARATERPRGSLLSYLFHHRATIGRLTLQHLTLVGLSLLAAIALAVPLGLLLERARGSAELVIRGVGLLQTMPNIALLAFMIPLLGIGVLPAVVALFLYSLYPILRNTFTGVRDANVAAVEAARALGMTPGQVLRHVRLPLAAPVIMAGVRTAAVINVGTATLAAFIGAGGLGDPIVAGLALSDEWMILSGALPAAVLALMVDGVLAGCERLVKPGG